MFKRVVMASVLCIALTVAVAAAHGHKTKTDVGPPMYQPAGTKAADGYIEGTVSTSKESCGDGRKVTVYRKKPGKDEKIGSVKAAAGGRAARAGNVFLFGYLVRSRHTQTGKYYAVAKPTSKCAGDRSKTSRIKPSSRSAATAPRRSGKAKVKINLSTYQATTNGNGFFVGSIDSKKKSCADGVKVTVYLRKSGKDQTIGTKKSFSGKGEGYSFTVNSRKTKEGTYYAKANGSSQCEPGKSKALKLKFA